MDTFDSAICGIYAITNNVSKRVYVGSAISIKHRWKTHKNMLRRAEHPSKLLQASWTKHGEDAFSFSILEPVPSKQELLSREQYWIDRLDSANAKIGFNLAPTAGSQIGFKHSRDSKKKMREAKLGRKVKFSSEHRQNLSLSLKDKKRVPHPESVRLKMREAHKKRFKKYGWQYVFKF